MRCENQTLPVRPGLVSPDRRSRSGMPMMTAQFQAVPGAATTTAPWRPRLRLPRRPDGVAGDPGKALAILTGWQRAAFRGYAIAEKRADRRLVVTGLAAELSAEKLAVSCL